MKFTVGKTLYQIFLYLIVLTITRLHPKWRPIKPPDISPIQTVPIYLIKKQYDSE